MSLTQLRTKKCSGCGHIRGPKEGDECVSCGAHDKWKFFCEQHNKMFASSVCDACERAAIQEEAERRYLEEERERRRQQAEERERRRRELEEENRRKHEQARVREKAFVRVAAIPAFIALTSSVLCLILASQLLTYGTLVIPYSRFLIFSFLGLAASAATSVGILAMWDAVD